MFISDGLSSLPIRCPTDEYMESYTKVTLTQAGEWNTLDIGENGQWYDYNDDASFGANVFATSYTW